jgi:hypothetical protein
VTGGAINPARPFEPLPVSTAEGFVRKWLQFLAHVAAELAGAAAAATVYGLITAPRVPFRRIREAARNESPAAPPALSGD